MTAKWAPPAATSALTAYFQNDPYYWTATQVLAFRAAYQRLRASMPQHSAMPVEATTDHAEQWRHGRGPVFDLWRGFSKASRRHMIEEEGERYGIEERVREARRGELWVDEAESWTAAGAQA